MSKIDEQYPNDLPQKATKAFADAVMDAARWH